MSSNINVATAFRMTRDELAASMAQGSLPEQIAIIDVRDDDYIGGHIKGCINVPSGQLDWKLPELVRQLHDKDAIIFHCALSQQRGPKAAMRYLQERQRLLRQEPARSRDDLSQKVFVLDGGFVRWQEKYGQESRRFPFQVERQSLTNTRYGTDDRLTEGYISEIWGE